MGVIQHYEHAASSGARSRAGHRVAGEVAARERRRHTLLDEQRSATQRRHIALEDRLVAGKDGTGCHQHGGALLSVVAAEAAGLNVEAHSSVCVHGTAVVAAAAVVVLEQAVAEGVGATERGRELVDVQDATTADRGIVGGEG